MTVWIIPTRVKCRMESMDEPSTWPTILSSTSSSLFKWSYCRSSRTMRRRCWGGHTTTTTTRWRCPIQKCTRFLLTYTTHSIPCIYHHPTTTTTIHNQQLPIHKYIPPHISRRWRSNVLLQCHNRRKCMGNSYIDCHKFYWWWYSGRRRRKSTNKWEISVGWWERRWHPRSFW